MFIFLLSATKEGIDDWRRASVDRQANARPYVVYRRGGRMPGGSSGCIRVGDLVQVHDGEEVPCDLMLLRIGGQTGLDDGGREAVALLSTASLDGEPDLKVRRPRPETQALPLAELLALRGRLSCEPPNSDLYRFDARLSLRGVSGASSSSVSRTALDEGALNGDVEGGGASSLLPLSAEQLVQHGTVVERTGWLLGVALCE